MSITAYGKRHLFLAGFMGTGKSAVGRALADKLARQFYDLDELIISMTGRSIAETFRIQGEAEFRLHEAKALRSIAGSAGAVIALGGGAPTTPLIVDIIRRTGRTVLLTSSWPAIWERIKDDDSRPLVASVPGGRENDSTEGYERFVLRAESILNSRLPLFHSIADHVLDTSELTREAAAERLAQWWIHQAGERHN